MKLKGISLSILLALTLLFPAVAVPRIIPSLSTAVQKGGKADVKVWVNTNSGVYHCPGTQWYGKTKKGEYMTQKQAQDKGYRPAYGKVCE
ncbi:MAG: hypothetical protein ACREDR_01985 [Blastocatellia bacterium]